jgi:hypothetical protein
MMDISVIRIKWSNKSEERRMRYVYSLSPFSFVSVETGVGYARTVHTVGCTYSALWLEIGYREATDLWSSTAIS